MSRNTDYEEENPVDTREIKHRLVAYKSKEREIENQLERLDWIESKLGSIGSPVLSDMPKSPSPSQDRTTDIIIQKVSLENEIKNAIQEQKTERESIDNILKKLSSPDERAVIRMRYFDGATWYDIVGMLFGAKKDFLKKEDTYLRRTHKIHGSALVNMTLIVRGVTT